MTTDINKAMKQVERKRNLYTTTIDKAIMKLYKKVGEEYSKKIAANPNVDNNTLKEHEEYFKKEYEKVAKSLESTLKSKMKRMINDTVKAQENNINDLCKKYKLDFGTTFQDKFSKVNEDALRMLVSGKVYKDKVSLSGRIWNNKKKVDEHIAFLLAQKKHPMDIARELEQYVNPAARKYTNAEGYKYTGRQVEYNALRLARTYINHAYQEAARDTSEANPFIKKLIWKSSHHKNMCGLCGSRDGKEYDPKDMPLDHPNGFCSFTYKTDSLEDTAEQLKKWMNGESNKDLDKWYKNNFGKNPSSIKNTKIPKPKKEIDNDADIIANNKRLKIIVDFLNNDLKVAYNKVKRHEKTLTENEIINALSGGDKTVGSCASLGFAYIGQKGGLNVLDFRGGNSQEYFSGAYIIKDIAEFTGVGEIEYAKTSMTAAKKALKKMENGKEYYLAVGKHAAIVRKTKDDKLQYLELQSPDNSGWINFDDGIKATLSCRFGCTTKGVGFDRFATVIDVDKMKDLDELRILLGYINTAEDEQKKGRGGYAK